MSSSVFDSSLRISYSSSFVLNAGPPRRNLEEFPCEESTEDALIFKRYTPESRGMHPNSLAQSTFEKIKGMLWDSEKERILWQEFNNRYGGKWFLSQRNLVGTSYKNEEAGTERLTTSPCLPLKLSGR